ncbi:copper amine oxidase N-terminal domain-containing protein [Carboxydocella sp. JDF658]|uniref:copper amine oxidase N-terminal domain-containing protein n=1 Tax=Carboxydocella sp. JDF658 TaxID=1926600 RepID=UPI0009ACB652|nr:copper amine oxidase N-terminal domain-containing protein [Carboxydocella sp. JDF658]GAW32836.1 copper amine oxidase-like protein [Carboxydocella sp. JDF658]
MKKVLISFLFVVFLLPATLVWAWEDHIILGRTYDGEVDTTHTIPGYSLEQMLKFLYYEASNVEEILAIDGVPISKTPWKKYGGKINPKVKKPDPIDTTPRDKSIPIIINLTDGRSVFFPDQKPFLKNSRVYIPVRPLAEMLGAQVIFNMNTKEVTIIKNETVVVFTLGSKKYLINNQEKNMDVVPFIINNRTVLPVRYICEAFGHEVEWNENSYTVWIEVRNK